MATSLTTGNAAGAEFRERALVYDDYVRECLTEIGLLPDEITGLFADNSRLVAEIAGETERQDKSRKDFVISERDKARERMRRVRAQKKGQSTYRAANGQLKPTP